ncbi:LuxR C-terminal-related transcriptional regulator [Elizabethkingia anophelis]|uniref:LuxR C-terminal-related transcriptional regulator n=1 Tax=Elizabethkingia anophelis TaxID=1117645 RepID=UPI003208A63E
MKRILIITNQYIVGAGIIAAFSSQANKFIIEHTHYCEEIFYRIEQNNFHLIILDSEVIRNNNKNMIDELKKHNNFLKIIIYTSYKSFETVRNIYKRSEGFLNMYAQKDDILLVVNNILGNNHADSSVTGSKMGMLPCPLKELSCRELQIFNLLVKGHNNSNISKALNIKMSTVSTYKSRIFEKLGINTIAELISIKHLL